MDEYEIRIVRLIPHPSGDINQRTQLLINTQLTPAALGKVMAAIANELNYLTELQD